MDERERFIAQANARNEAARRALDEIKAKLNERPPEADLWDAVSVDERLHMLAKSYRERRSAGGIVPQLTPKPSRAMASYSWDQLGERNRNIARVACCPMVEWAQSVARNGEVAAL